jgi:ubiquinone/menaquinone biosynthesis C-methylase UbiE
VTTFWLLVLGLPATLTLLVILLRLVSRHHATTCPAWLAVLLENPYMNRLAGAEVILDRAGVTEALAVLDVGCGTGRVALPAAVRVGPAGRVVALDLQPAMLERTAKRVRAAGLGNIETVPAGIGEGSLERESFDRAIMVTVLGEIVDQAAGLREIHAALKPGGILSVTEVLPDPHYQSKKRVRRLAEMAGFEVIETMGPWYAFTMNVRK